MAAAADRVAGDVFERVSPELVLVDATLAEEVRRRLGVPDDTVARTGRMGSEPRLSFHVAEVGLDEETVGEGNAVDGGDAPPVPAAAMHHDLGIDDLIVIPDDDLRSVPPLLVVVPTEVTQRVAEPQETVAQRVPDAGDAIVEPADARTQPPSTRRSYPALPSPSNDADEEDATDVVLRVIRDQIEHEAPPKRRRRLLLRLAPRRG